MGTYRPIHPMMSEANRTASIPRFAWFPPGAVFSTDTTAYNPFQPPHFNVHAPLPLAAIPVQSVPAPPLHELSQTDSNVIIDHTKPEKAKNFKRTSEDVPTKPSSTPMVKRVRKNLKSVAYGGNLNISGIPAPFCSCTGVSRQCYRWGAGGWQSSCCTINISKYPLPMNVSRPGSRVAGRKMSCGAFEKLLQRLASDGYDLIHPIDLREHWARHGTNKFVTIK